MGVGYETASITKGCDRANKKLKKSRASSKEFVEDECVRKLRSTKRFFRTLFKQRAEIALYEAFSRACGNSVNQSAFRAL